MDAHRNRGPEQGFTLIELMVVVLIIGILIGIAFPIYIGARQRAEDRAAQEDVRTALLAGLTYHAESQTFTGFDVAAGQAAEPSLTWIGGGAPAAGEISIHVAAGPNLLLVGFAPTGTYWCVAQVAGSPNTSRGGDSDFLNVDTVGECIQGW